MRNEYNPIIIKYVAEYLRKSRGETTEDLIKHKTILEELCKSRGWVYVVYEEVETGESLFARPVMQQLLRDVEDNIYDAVVCVDLDRLGRGDLVDWGQIKRVFQKTNTYMVTPSSLYNLNDDNEEFAVDLQTLFARREYKKITHRLSMGKKVGAKLGAWTNGTPPMPYEYQEWIDPATNKRYYNEKGLVVNLQKLSIYRFMVDSFIKDKKSTNEIAWELNRRNIPSPRGGRWCNMTVRRLLVDETHLGKIISNKTKGDGHKNKSPNKQPFQKIPKEQWTVVENRHEAIKTQDEHEKILIGIQKNLKSPYRRSDHYYPLKGLIKCGLCGYGLPLEYKRGKDLIVKKCWHKDYLGNKCPNSSGKAQYIIDAIDEQLKEYEEQIRKEIESCEDQSTDLIQLQIKTIMDKLNKKDIALKRARIAYDEGVDTLDEYRSAKERILKEVDELENQLSIENLKLQKAQSITNHEKLHYIEEFRRSRWEDELDDKELNDLYKTIISSIIWTKQGDNIDIKVNFL
jgi:DNA invertase Pin-like site-specific DNA recombinase|nr:MAG TPA: integrase [Caudoviricetes sp.]